MQRRANAAELIKKLEQAKIINLDVSARTLVDAVESIGDIDPWDLICYPFYWHPPRLGDREVLRSRNRVEAIGRESEQVSTTIGNTKAKLNNLHFFLIRMKPGSFYVSGQS